MASTRARSVEMMRTHALKGRIREQRGAAAVEFALVAVLLFMILFGIIVWGTVFSKLEVLNGAAREGARLAAVGGTNGTVSNIRARVVSAASPYTLDNGSSTGGGIVNVSVKKADGTPVSQDPPCQNSTAVPPAQNTSQGQVTVSWTQ